MNASEEISRETAAATAKLREYTDSKPTIGIILGTGLGSLAEEIVKEAVIGYEDIDHFPLSTVESHSGKMIFGMLGKKAVVAMQGRFHYYEGYSLRQITFPVRVMKALGVRNLIISNASGSVNPYIRKGDIMLIDDHINLLGENPLRGLNDDLLGQRFTDMSEPYSRAFQEIIQRIALDKGIKLQRGVYAMMSGPSLETRAEYRMLQVIGADTIGMSTVAETITARHCGMRVLGLSVITDECYPESLQKLVVEDVIAAANMAEPTLTKLIREFVAVI